MTGNPTMTRRRAKHCAELLGAGPSIGELVPALSLVGERLARAVSATFGRLTGTDAPVVRVGMPMDCTLGTIQSELETLASHCLMSIGPAARPLLATFEAAPVFRLVDRAFGGRGLVPDPLPEVFPMSAELLLGRLEEALAAAISVAFGGQSAHRTRPLRRDTSLRQLDPFPKSEDLLRLDLDVEEEGCEPWSLSLAFPQATLAALFAGSRHPVRQARRTAPADPEDEPFASLPVPVTAVLVDMRMAFSRLSGLKPGDMLPVAVARNVPLRIDGRTVATGTVGEIDDRVAVQVSQAF